MDAKTTVYKKTDDVYQLKLKHSRVFFAEAEKKFGQMPFTLRAFEDEKKAKLEISLLAPGTHYRSTTDAKGYSSWIVDTVRY